MRGDVLRGPVKSTVLGQVQFLYQGVAALSVTHEKAHIKYLQEKINSYNFYPIQKIICIKVYAVPP